MSQVVVRIAPSPTGQLHLGNARASVFNDLYARRHQGRLVLRLDDTDRERSTEAFAQGIVQDLAWLGLRYDTIVRQSDRLDRYQQQADHLKTISRLYPCYETPEELSLKRKQQLARKHPPVYDRTSLKLTDAQKQAYEAEGRRPHWRFLLNDEPLVWHDMIRGSITVQGKHLSDPVLVRADGQPVYTLASVVDDQDLGITHIIRGEDHITNTAVQIQLWKALGCDVESFHFGHFPLIVDQSGAGFSKREGSLSLASLRDQGIEPMAICSLLAHLGSSHDITPYPDLETLAQDFNLDQISKNPPHFHQEMLTQMNHKWYGIAPYPTLRDRMQTSGDVVLNEDAWTLIRDNIATYHDVSQWIQILHGVIEPGAFPEEDRLFLKTVLDCFDVARQTSDLWATWIQSIKQQTGRQGAMLFKPLRRALTGLDHGPELKPLMTLMGLDRVRQRLADSL